ncbi:MAG: substrate-binding domain-containing protein [Polyangiaceae bacterium]|nr:substrate-binding domain-containing protein [Polyangiaceae bacterium]
MTKTSTLPCRRSNVAIACRSATILGAMLAASAGCSSGSTTRDQIHVAWVSKGRCNTFFDVSRFGARLAESELAHGSEADVDVEFLEPDDCSDEPDTSAAGDVPEECTAAAPQMVSVRGAIDGHFDAIAISVANPGCLSPLLDEAVEAGIKVLTFDSDAPDSERHTFYGIDNEAGARVAVRALASMIGERGQVAIQTSMTETDDGTYALSASSSYVERMTGITEELAQYPDITTVATVPCIGGDVTDAACAAELESVLEEFPDLKGFVLARGKVLREIDLDTKAPDLTARIREGTLRTVAFDAPDDSLDNIAAGYADLVIAQKQFGWGYDVVYLAYQMVAGELEPAAFSDSGWYVVCPNNVSQYATMWAEKDFRGEIEPCEYVSD